MNIEIYSRQREFLEAQQKYFLLAGGVMSGKSHVGALWALMQMQRFARATGGIFANTKEQLSQATMPKLISLLQQLQGEGSPAFDYVYNASPPDKWNVKSSFPNHNHILTTNTGSQVICRSLDNYDAVRGISLGWVWLDEARDTDKEAFDVILGRLRGFNNIYPNIPYQVRVTTTPNGFDWIYEKFVDPKTRLPNTGTMSVSSYENPFVPESVIRSVHEMYSAQYAAQEIYAQFVNLTAGGQAFLFDRNRNLKEVVYQPSMELIYSMDFNVSPLTAVIMQFTKKPKPYVQVLDEIYIEDAGQTAAACREFVRRYKDLKPSVVIYGDIAGKFQRSTRTTQSDWDIMLQEIKPHFQNCRVGADFRQQLVFEGIQIMNNLLSPAVGEPQMFIHPRCKYLIRDLERLVFVPGTRELDKSVKELSHCQDACRYPIAQNFPINAKVITGLK